MLDVLELDSCLSFDRCNKPAAQVFLGMWHDDNSWPRGVPEDVMGSAHPFDLPTSSLQLGDEAAALHIHTVHTTFPSGNRSKPQQVQHTERVCGR
jgi:hypothetical protein